MKLKVSKIEFDDDSFELRFKLDDKNTVVLSPTHDKRVDIRIEQSQPKSNPIQTN